MDHDCGGILTGSMFRMFSTTDFVIAAISNPGRERVKFKGP